MPNDEYMPSLIIEDTRLILKNFEGRAGEYNQEGNRNFGVLLAPEQAEQAERDGWRVRYLNPRNPDEGDEPQAWIKCNVAWRYRDGRPAKRPPRIVMITPRGKSPIEERAVKILDWADIEKVDITMRPFKNREGLANGYLQTLYVTVRPDDFEEKYYDIPDIDAVAEMDDEDEEF